MGFGANMFKGSPLFRICCKLRSLKPLLKTLNKKDFSDISSRVLYARDELEIAQIKLNKDPLSLQKQSSERNLFKKYSDLCKVEESFAKQKSRVQWLSLGDRNSSFFFRSVRNNINRNRISSVVNEVGCRLTKSQDVQDIFVQAFTNLFGAPFTDTYSGGDRVNHLIHKKLSTDQYHNLCLAITDEEIKDVL